MSNVEFTCPYMTGKIINFQLDFMTKNGSPILTKDTGLLYVGVCNLNPNIPVPCSKGLCKDWIKGLELNKKINGFPMLNEDAIQICQISGAIIKAKLKDTSKCAFIDTGEKLLAKINSAMNDVESNLSTSSINENTDYTKKESEKTLKQSDKEESLKADKNAAMFEQKVQNTIDYSYAVCGYKNCGRRDECEYIKEQYVLSSETLENASTQLRHNSSAKEIAYNEKCKLLKDETQTDWGEQAHHIISIRQIFAKFPELVKLANFYEYNINSEENCIYLPAVKKSYEIKEQLYKTAKAYEVMNITGMQWHSGGHSYKISREDFNRISDEKRNLLRCYEDVVTEEVKKFIIAYYFRDKSCCRYDTMDSKSKEIKKQRFKRRMDYISDKIYKKLDSFSEPKTSFPFYVSKLSMQYAYNVPKSGKIIYVEEKDSTIIYTKYHYTKHLKDSNNIILNEVGKFENVDDIKSLIVFCGNVKYFFVFNSSYKLPFEELSELYQIEIENNNLYIKNNSKTIYKREIGSYDKVDVLNKIRFFISERLMNDDDTYKAPQAVVLKRKRECGL